MHYTAAAIQFDPVLGAAAENLSRLLSMIEEAASAGARLIVTPEMGPCGYCFYDREEITPYVEPIPGPFTHHLANIAHRFDCVIVSGLAEVDGPTGLYYNTAAVVGPNGFIGKYRKMHHFVSDAKWSVEGNLGFGVWDTPVGRIGVEICMDAVFPESGRLLALQGAEVICFPTNWVGDGGCPSQRWISHAFENGAYLIAADRSSVERGVQFQGGSCIVNPDGRVQAVAATGDAAVYGEINLSDAHDGPFDDEGPEDKLGDRRPELYREMLQNTYGWGGSYFHGLYGAAGLPAPRQSHIGALQFLPQSGDTTRNADTVRRMAGTSHLDLIVLPELAMTGPPTDGVRASRDELQGVGELLQLAGETSSLLVTSLVEGASGRLYNTAVLAGPDGILARQRKRHLTRDDRSWATPGDEPFRAFDTPIGRIGLLVGYDALFWESIRTLASMGADLVCVPSALRWPRRQEMEGDCDWVYWRTKAWESCVALAVANRPGPRFAGNSAIVVPGVKEKDDLEVLTGPDDELLLSLVLDTSSKYIREKRGLSWRRLDAYSSLVAPPGAQPQKREYS